MTTAVRTGGPGHAGISLLVVEKGTPGFTVDRSLAKMGWHCSDTAELGFADVRVPAANLVGEENTGFAQIAKAFVTERLALAVHGYGIAARSLALTVGPRQRARDVRPARWSPTRWCGTGWSRCTAASTWPGPTPGPSRSGTSTARSPSSRRCTPRRSAVDAASYVCDQAVQLHGGTGYLHGTEVERHYRDARILGIGGGATEVLDDLTAELLGYTP